MIKGSPEWLNVQAARVATEAQAQLHEIVEAAAKRHGVEGIRLNEQDTVRMGMTLVETQDQSFILGLQLGMQLMMDVIEGKV